MSRFNNPVPVSVAVDFGEIDTESNKEQIQNSGVDFDLNPEPTPEPKQVKPESNPTPDPEPIVSKEQVSLDMGEEESEEKPEESNPSNFYLETINSFFDKGLFDPEDLYEGFSEDTDPSQEVLEKFIEHNLELREKKTLEEFVESVSPLTQRILSYDLNSKGEGLETYLRALIEENNIKALDVSNEYDQEKIVRLWYNDSKYSPEEINEKIEELKAGALLEKEAKRVKPKLDSKAEEIAKEQEESEAYLRQIEISAKNQFFDKVESQLRSGKSGDLSISKEVGQKIAQLLMIDDVPVTLPQGKQVKMSYLDAEILKHKYSSKGNPERLIQVAYLLVDPDGFYKQFANVARTKETNELVKQAKYNIKGTNPSPTPEKRETPKKDVGWNLPRK